VSDIAAPLVADHLIDYTYTRSTGPVIGAFMTALRDRRIVGVRGSDGRVIVPAVDYDPVTSDDLSELVEVGSSGVVATWAWNDDPKPGQPLDRPFAWALVTLDGADTAMLAAVDCGSAASIRTGLRVSARWADERVGSIRDLVCFDPEPAEQSA
jgi:uncharacterized OB-fold protein